MNGNEKKTTQIINEAFDTINKFENGNALFYKKFNKSRAVVSFWKSGKITPTISDMIRFIKVSNEVIKTCRAKDEKVNERKAQLLDTFSHLVAT